MQEYIFEPCPHCNGTNMLVESSGTKFAVHAVRCRKCDMQGPSYMFEEKAVDFWNRLPRLAQVQVAENSEILRLQTVIREMARRAMYSCPTNPLPGFPTDGCGEREGECEKCWLHHAGLDQIEQRGQSPIGDLMSKHTIHHCPWCNSVADLLRFEHPDKGPCYYVSCSRCHASGPEDTSPDVAVEKWNVISEKLRRADAPAV